MGIIKAAKLAFDYLRYEEEGEEPEVNRAIDHWGNRCYLFSAECPGYYTIEKGGFYFQDYTIDAESLRQLGGSYLLSAAYIDHSEDTGLELMRPEAFETENSYYRIYLYRVMDNE